MRNVTTEDVTRIKNFLRDYKRIKSWVFDDVEGEFKVYDRGADKEWIIQVEPEMELEDVLEELKKILNPWRVRKEMTGYNPKMPFWTKLWIEIKVKLQFYYWKLFINN